MRNYIFSLVCIVSVAANGATLTCKYTGGEIVRTQRRGICNNCSSIDEAQWVLKNEGEDFTVDTSGPGWQTSDTEYGFNYSFGDAGYWSIGIDRVTGEYQEVKQQRHSEGYYIQKAICKKSEVKPNM